MTTTLQRLLKYPHADVFDKTPQPELALRVRHAYGASWRIAEGILVVTAGGVSYDYDLTEYTVAKLADQLEADGFDIHYLSAQFANHGAMVLVEGEGFEGKTNGDHIYAYTSTLWALFNGYAGELRHAELQMYEALRQMVIPQSEGEWLDLWGALYAAERIDGESDSGYAARIPEEAFRIRVNALAIEKTIKDRTGHHVEIKEPWKQMFSLDHSSLSGTDHLPDDRYYSYFVIHPISHSGAIDWDEILPIIERNRAAGVEVYAPAYVTPVYYVQGKPPLEYRTHFGGEVLNSTFARGAGEAALGDMRLDENSFVLNHPMSQFSVRGFSNLLPLAMGDHDGDLLDDTFILDLSILPAAAIKTIIPRSVALASIALSDGVALGDENAILSRGMITSHAEPRATLSGEVKPSDYTVILNHNRVVKITIDVKAERLIYPSHGISVGGRYWETGTVARFIQRGGPLVAGFSVSSVSANDILDGELILDISEIT